jgi:hypothetical protein
VRDECNIGLKLGDSMHDFDDFELFAGGVEEQRLGNVGLGTGDHEQPECQLMTDAKVAHN